MHLVDDAMHGRETLGALTATAATRDRTPMRCAVLVVVLAAAAAAAVLRLDRKADAADDAAEVLATARAAQARFADKTSRVEMRVVAPSGEERVRTLQGLEKRTDGGRKLLWLFESPAELAGTGFLAWQAPPATDEMWVYFPGQRRVRRVSPDLRREQFQGSTFTYEDLTTVFYLDYDGSHTLRGEEACGEQRCRVVETELPEGRFVYRRLKTWIRDGDHLPQRIDLEGDGVTKHLRVLRTETIEGIPTIVEAEMTSDADGYRTVVRYDGIDYDRGLTDEQFTVGALERKGK
jgi:hypothetical protein